MFLIGYMATKDPATSIITAVALLLSIQALASNEVVTQVSESFANAEVESQTKVEMPLTPCRGEFVENCKAKAEMNALII